MGDTTFSAQPDKARLWSAATWAAPVTAPVALGSMFLAQWVLGKLGVFAEHERGWFLSGIAISTVVSLAAGAALASTRTPSIRGAGLALLGSSVIVLVGGVVYSFWLLRW